MEQMDQQYCQELLSIMEGIRQISLQLHPLPLIPIQEFIALHMIWDHWQHADSPGIQSSDLSQVLHMSKPATSKMLNQLEEKGYIVRSGSVRDRRAVYISLTEPGREILTQAKAHFEALAGRIFAKIGEQQAQNLLISLQAMKEAVDELLREEKNRAARAPQP